MTSKLPNKANHGRQEGESLLWIFLSLELCIRPIDLVCEGAAEALFSRRVGSCE